MIEQIKPKLKKIIKKRYRVERNDVHVDKAIDGVGADYYSKEAFLLAKQLRRKPLDIANEIAEDWKSSQQYSVGSKMEANVAEPGYLNFNIDDGLLHENLADILKQKNKYGHPREKRELKVLIEYFQPNIAKPLHIGHMRSAIIGDSLFRINALCVDEIGSDTHMGDWGTQFGILLYAYKKYGDDKIIKTDPINELNKLYIKANTEIEAKPELRELAKAEFVKLEKNDKENRRLWQQFVKWSEERFFEIYDLLDIKKHKHNWPESFYEDKMPAVVEKLKAANLLKESQGAQVVDLSEHNLGTAIIIKSDGGTTYLLRDLATYLFRKQKGYSKQLYVVDSRQSHHFNQLFKILELLGELTQDDAEHIDFGFMSLPEGALSTRKGNIIELEKLVNEAIQKAKKTIQDKNPQLENSDKVARQVAIGALKYFDLSHNRHSDIVFTWEKVLNFEGNTGPYIQYTHARLHSILRKAHEMPLTKSFEFKFDIERDLLTFLSIYPSLIQTASFKSEPKVLTDYLFGLASIANKYYQEIRILEEENKAVRKSRLALIQGTVQVLKNGLALLGIEAPEEM